MPRATVRKGPPLPAPEPKAEGSRHNTKCFHRFGGGTVFVGIRRKNGPGEPAEAGAQKVALQIDVDGVKT